MNARNKKYEWRPESIKLDIMTIEAMEPVMKKALAMGFPVDSFYYIVCNSINDMIKCYISEKTIEEDEKKGG